MSRRRTFSGSSARHCEARTSRTCEVPMPNASAPNAPCVDVWLSPHAIVMPGCVRPSSGPITWTMPCSCEPRSCSGTPKLAAVLLERREHLLGLRVGEGPREARRRDDVVHGRDRARRERHAPAARAQHLEGLRARDLVDEMEAHEELRLPGGQLADRVKVPDLREERRGHPFQRSRALSGRRRSPRRRPASPSRSAGRRSRCSRSCPSFRRRPRAGPRRGS